MSTHADRTASDQARARTVRAWAARAVATAASDADDARLLLDALGLGPADAARARRLPRRRK